jgi:hypothetical protein
VIRDRVTPRGEQDVVTPPGIVRGGEVQRDQDERMDVLYAGRLGMDVGNDGGLIVIVQRSSATGEGGVGAGGSISATTAWGSSARMTVVCSSSSRSAVVERTRVRATSYFFVSVAAATMASSFCQNSAASIAWRASSVAIEGGVATYRVAVRSPEMQRKKRGRQTPRV